MPEETFQWKYKIHDQLRKLLHYKNDESHEEDLK